MGIAQKLTEFGNKIRRTKMDSFGKRLAELRKEHNLTQNDVAEKLNVSPQAVSKWENDLTSPDIETLIKLAEMFDISVDELVGKKSAPAQYLQEGQRKNINKMMMKIIGDSSDGDKVRLNLPMAAVKIFVKSGSMAFGNKAMEDIDFNQIIDLAEQGMVGELVTVDSADGAHVHIVDE